MLRGACGVGKCGLYKFIILSIIAHGKFAVFCVEVL